MFSWRLLKTRFYLYFNFDMSFLLFVVVFVFVLFLSLNPHVQKCLKIVAVEILRVFDKECHMEMRCKLNCYYMNYYLIFKIDY